MATQTENKELLMRAETQQAFAELGRAVSRIERPTVHTVRPTVQTVITADLQSVRSKPTRHAVRENARLGSQDVEIQQGSLGSIIFHSNFETFGGCIVLVNFAIMTMETHATAVEDDNALRAAVMANKILLGYYTLEFLARLKVLGKKFFKTMWNNLDFGIVVTGLIGEVLELSQVSGSSMGQIAMLKSLRMLRLLRLVRLLVAFRELYVLVAGIGRCMKTLFWASLLIFLVLNVWAILSVEFLDAKVRELDSAGAFTTCGWCPTAFANIWYANVTWFQIISTADWTPIGRPLAEKFYWPYLFFVFCIFVVIWGLLNLIVAGLVDANIAARQEDVAAAAIIAQGSQQDAWDSFADLCKAMDEDGSGDISVEEFKEFWKDNRELQQHMTIMGVRENDVDGLLKLMAEDSGGILAQHDFVEQFTSMRTLVEKTTLFFVLKFVKSIQANVLIQRDELASIKRLCQAKSFPPELSMGSPMGSPRSARTFGSPVGSPMGSPRCAPIPVKSALKSKSTGRGNHVSVEAPHEPGALRTAAAQTLKAEKSAVDPQVLPHGWYYFGNSLPSKAGIWCEAMDFKVQVSPKSNVSSNSTSAGADIHGTRFDTDRQGWEPLPSSGPTAHANPMFRYEDSINLLRPEHGAVEKVAWHPEAKRTAAEVGYSQAMDICNVKHFNSKDSPPLPSEARAAFYEGADCERLYLASGTLLYNTRENSRSYECKHMEGQLGEC